MSRGLTALAAAFRGTGERCEREQIAGVNALVSQPRSGTGPVVVYANAATPRGVEQPAVGRFLGGLARAGFVAVAPELPNVREGEVTPATVDALVAVARSAGPRVAFIGASTGAGLAILAAGERSLADRVSAVMALAPFASIRHVLRLGTTGFYGERPYPAASLVARAAVRSLASSAPDDPAMERLLANRDAHRFDALYAELRPATRALLEELSPVTRIGQVRAPVELASAPDDPFFPVEESRALVRAGRDVRLTVTPALDHVRPRFRPGLLRVAAALDRTLRRAAALEPVPVLRPSTAS